MDFLGIAMSEVANVSERRIERLVNYQLNSNEWYVRQARTILQERAPNPKVYEALKQILANNPDITRKLRALWTLQVTNGISETELQALLSHNNEHIRSWAIQFLSENKKVSESTLAIFSKLSKIDASPIVRLYLTSAMLRLDPASRWEVMENLAQKEEDLKDHNLPNMYWYAMEPLAALDANKALKLVEKSKFPKLLPNMIQRVGALKTDAGKLALKELNTRLAASHEHTSHEMMALIKKVLEE